MRSPLHVLAPFVGLAAAVLLAMTTLGYRESPLPDMVNACGNGPTCRQVNCHFTYPTLRTDLPWTLEEQAGPLPPAYVPGRTYSLRLAIDDTLNPGAAAWGFELAPILGCPFGPLTAAGDVVPLDPGRIRRFTAGGVTYLSHWCTCVSQDPSCCGYRPQVTPGLIDWPFLWHAPPAGTGDVTFHMAFNTANWDGTPDFDWITLGTVTLAEDACPPPVSDLRVRLAECEPASPGEERVELTWTGGPATVRTTSDRAMLGVDPALWTDAGTACPPLDPAPVTFYSVALPCPGGAEGPH